MKRMHLSVVAASVVLAFGLATLAHAQRLAQPPVEIIKGRQQGLKSLGAAFKVVRDELKSDNPDGARIRKAAADVSEAAGAIKDWFPAGTGPDSGIKTDAKAEIWTEAAGFATAEQAFVREAGKFVRVTSGPDAAAWKEGAASLGQACKGCHDSYRVRKE
jgi:cytochrome c556